MVQTASIKVETDASFALHQLIMMIEAWAPIYSINGIKRTETLTATVEYELKYGAQIHQMRHALLGSIKMIYLEPQEKAQKSTQTYARTSTKQTQTTTSQKTTRTSTTPTQTTTSQNTTRTIENTKLSAVLPNRPINLLEKLNKARQATQETDQAEPTQVAPKSKEQGLLPMPARGGHHLPFTSRRVVFAQVPYEGRPASDQRNLANAAATRAYLQAFGDILDTQYVYKGEKIAYLRVAYLNHGDAKAAVKTNHPKMPTKWDRLYDE